MPRSYRVVSEGGYAYFVTCSIVDWIALFEHAVYRQIILDSLAHIREHKNTRLNAFVVMPTHVHAILWPRDDVNTSDVLRDFKRYTSRSISRTAESQGDRHYLAGFAAARQAGRPRAGSKYQVWQEGSHAEAIYSDDFAIQKIEYIHANPVKAGLVARMEDWPYSSARAYLSREETYPPTDMLPLS